MTVVRDEICRTLDEFLNYLAKLTEQDLADLNRSIQPSQNLLINTILQSLRVFISEESTSDEIAINKVENLMQSVQYNHKKKTDIENKFFELFTVDKINEWKAKAEKKAAPDLVIAFGGTGNAIHLAGEAHNKMANGYFNDGFFPGAYVYNIPGVASDSDCIHDPDVLGISGEITGRNPEPGFIFHPGLAKGQKSVAGIGLVEAVKDAYEHIRQRIEAGQIADDGEITLLGHSRGAVETLLLAKLLLNNPNLLGNRKLTVIAHDPVLGRKLPPGTFQIENKSYNVNELLYLETDADSERVNIIIPIAMSDFRHDEFALIDLAKYEKSMSKDAITVEPHPGHHSAALVDATNINCNVVANQFDEKFATRGWFRANFAGESLERQTKFDALHKDYIYLMEHYYLKKGKALLSDEDKRMCIDIYDRWIYENYDRALGNPGYHAAITDSPRYVNPNYLSRIPGLFYNRHHEELIKSLAPNFCAEVLNNYKLGNPKKLSDIINQFAEEFNSLPKSFKNLVSVMSQQNLKDNQRKLDEYKLSEQKEIMPMWFNLLKNMFFYPAHHANKTRHAMHTKLPGLDKTISASSTLQEIELALSMPRKDRDNAFSLEIHTAVTKFLENPKDDSEHTNPSIRLRYFLTKEFCLYLAEKLNCKKMNQEDKGAIERLRDNITKVNKALISIGTVGEIRVRDKLDYISDYIVPTLRTGSFFHPCNLSNHLQRGIEHFKNSAAKLTEKDSNMEVLLKLQKGILGEGFKKQWNTALLGGVDVTVKGYNGAKSEHYNLPTTMFQILIHIKNAYESKGNDKKVKEELETIQSLLNKASMNNNSIGTFFSGRDSKTKVFYNDWSQALSKHMMSQAESIAILALFG